MAAPFHPWNRDLSVTRKQWMTQDPIRDGLNWQAYLGGVADPVNMIDMWGLWTAHLGIDFSDGCVGGGHSGGGLAISYSKKEGFELGTFESAGGRIVYRFWQRCSFRTWLVWK